MNDPFDERPAAGGTDTRRSQRWTSGRVATVAAVIVLAIGAVGLAVLLDQRNDDDSVPTVAGGPDKNGATGFYVPSALPEGWEVTALDVDSDDGGRDGTGILGCPCSITEFDRAGTDGYLAVTSHADPEALGRGAADRDPLSDLDGWYEQSGQTGVVVWKTAEGSRAIVSEALDRDALEGLADGWTEDEPPTLDGYRVSGSRRIDHRIDEVPRVEWTIGNADTDAEVTISLEPTVVAMNVFATSTVTLPGNGLTAGLMDEGRGRPVIGSWPGEALATVRSLGPIAVDDDDDEPVPPTTDVDTALTILGSFQPVDADAWSDHLSSVPLDENRVTRTDLDAYRTERISDWLITNGDTSRPTDPDGTIIDVEPTSTSTTITTTITTTIPAGAQPAAFAVDFADGQLVVERFAGVNFTGRRLTPPTSGMPAPLR